MASPLLLALSLATSAPAGADPAFDLPPVKPARPVRVALATTQCELRQPGSDALDSQRCLTCHGTGGGAPEGCVHPVHVRYQQAKGYASGRLRSEAEVERRGVLLLDGRVECTSCHDGRSTWADHVVLLPGAAARAPSLPPATGRAFVRDPGPARSGGAIDSTPLCSACHHVTGD